MAFWELSGFIPIFATLGALYAWAHFRSSWKGEKPVREKLLRSPGESLRIKIEGLIEKLAAPLFIMTGIGLILGKLTSTAMQGRMDGDHLLVGAWACGAIGMILCGARIVHVSRLIADYRLGFGGERAVGEELNRLMLDGCLVYHDLVVDNWNIDHVVIAPSGVYCLETKCYRKKRINGVEFYKVKFDGQELHFPHRRDRKPIEQACRNAGWLSDMLSKSLADPVQVQPIVTLPGWWVDRTGKGDVVVLNHREFRQCVVRKGPPQLSEKQMQQIAYQIEQRCRDVAF